MRLENFNTNDYSILASTGAIFDSPLEKGTIISPFELVNRREEFGFKRMKIPFTMVDSLANSSLKLSPTLEFHALLSQGYLYKTNCEGFDYLRGALAASMRPSAELYAFLPGKSGCHVKLILGQGSKRFSSAYHRVFAGFEKSRFIEIDVDAIYFLNEENAESVKERLEEVLRKAFRGPERSGLLRRFLERRKDTGRVPANLDGILKVYQSIKAIELALDYQRRAETVMEEILRVLQGTATKKDYERIYDAFNPVNID